MKRVIISLIVLCCLIVPTSAQIECGSIEHYVNDDNQIVKCADNEKNTIEEGTDLKAVRTIMLRAGSPIRVCTDNEINSNDTASAKYALVEYDIFDESGKYKLIKKITPVKLNLQRKKSRTMGRPGRISVTGGTTYTVNGQPVELTIDNIEFVGKGRQGLAHGLSWGLLEYGWINPVFLASPLFLLIKGGKAKIPSGTLLPYMRVADNVTVEIPEERTRETN